MKEYTMNTSTTGIINNQIWAESLEDAYLKALLTYGLDAIGSNFVCAEDGSWSAHVCYKAWETMLAERCPKATMIDVFNAELAFMYYRIGKYTLEEAKAKSRLWRWMERVGFLW